MLYPLLFSPEGLCFVCQTNLAKLCMWDLSGSETFASYRRDLRIELDKAVPDRDV